MSWLADRNATAMAADTVASGASAGSDAPISRMATISNGWITASQPRRRPQDRKAGGRALSSNGDQMNFRE